MILFAYLFSAALFLQKDSLLTDTLRKDSIWKNVNLENITIKGSNIAHYPDKDVYTITDEMRKNTIDTYGILEKLPGMFVDKIDRSITYKGKQNIIVLVDGKKKDISYIGNLHNMRFKKIEVYENTHPRYLNADVVINVITKEQWQGFDFSDNTSAKAQPSAKYGKLFTRFNELLSYTYTRPKFDFATSFEYNHNNGKHDQFTEYTQANLVRYKSVEDDNPDAAHFSNNYLWWADFDYKLSEKHTISLKYSYEHTNYNSWGDIAYKKEDLLHGTSYITEQHTENRDNSQQHTLTFFYRGNTNTWNLYADAGINIYTDNTSYCMDESSLFITTNQYHHKRNVYSASFDATKAFNQRSSLNFSTNGFYRHYSGRENNNNSLQINNNFYLNSTISYRHRFNQKLSGSLIFSMINYHVSAEGQNENQTAFSGAAIIRFSPIKDWDVSLRYFSSVSPPRYSEVLSYTNRKDSLIYETGNPFLKTAVTHGSNLSINKGSFYISVSLQYAGNRIASEYQWTNNSILLTSQNINNTGWSISGGIGPLTSKNRKFSYRMNLTYGGEHLWHNDNKNTYTYWKGIANATYTDNNYGVTLQYSVQPQYSATTQQLNKIASDAWRLSMWRYFLEKRFMIQLTYQLPIKWGIGKSNTYSISTPFYEYDKTINTYNDNRNYLFLTVRYLLAKGHRVRKNNNSQSNKGTVNEFNHD